MIDLYEDLRLKFRPVPHTKILYDFKGHVNYFYDTFSHFWGSTPLVAINFYCREKCSMNILLNSFFCALQMKVVQFWNNMKASKLSQNINFQMSLSFK